jgi:hypothetical protein
MKEKRYRNNLVVKDKPFNWNIRVRVLPPGEIINRELKAETIFWTIKVILN